METEGLIEDLRDFDYRHAFAAEHIDMVLARQIRAIRQQRGVTQTQLAQMIGSGQSFISAIEDEDYGSISLSKLKDLARAFDTFLTVRFDSFGELVHNVDRTSMTDLHVPKFDEDPAFNAQASGAYEIVIPATVRREMHTVFQVTTKATTTNRSGEYVPVLPDITPMAA